MEMKFDIVYTIQESKSWRSENGIIIKSNLADDELIQCELSKSLVEYLKKEAAVLNPDKFLLALAESQKRGLQDNIKSMDDLALTAKIRADKMNELITQSAIEAEAKYAELEEKFRLTQQRFNSAISNSKAAIEEDIKSVEAMSKKLDSINQYSLERLSETLKKILAIAENDKDLMKLVLEHKKE